MGNGLRLWGTIIVLQRKESLLLPIGYLLSCVDFLCYAFFLGNAKNVRSALQSAPPQPACCVMAARCSCSRRDCRRSVMVASRTASRLAAGKTKTMCCSSPPPNSTRTKESGASIGVLLVSCRCRCGAGLLGCSDGDGGLCVIYLNCISVTPVTHTHVNQANTLADLLRRVSVCGGLRRRRHSLGARSEWRRSVVPLQRILRARTRCQVPCRPRAHTSTHDGLGGGDARAREPR